MIYLKILWTYYFMIWLAFLYGTKISISDCWIDTHLFQINKNDGFPTGICNSCSISLNIAINFKHQCTKANDDLHASFLANNTIITELKTAEIFPESEFHSNCDNVYLSDRSNAEVYCSKFSNTCFGLLIKYFRK